MKTLKLLVQFLEKNIKLFVWILRILALILAMAIILLCVTEQTDRPLFTYLAYSLLLLGVIISILIFIKINHKT